MHRRLFDGLKSGDAADFLLALPIALEQGSVDGFGRPAAATITNAPARRERMDAGIGGAGSWVVSAARGGGFVVNIVRDGDRLQLIGCLREEDPDHLIEEIAARLLRALDERPSPHGTDDATH